MRLPLTGVTHYQEITINAAQVAETNPHFLYQVKIPRGALVASACTSSTNVVVYKSTTDTTKSPKWVVYTTDTLFLYSDQAVSTSTGGRLVVGYGLNVNTVNSASTFTNCGIAKFWGLDYHINGSTPDYAGSATGTLVSPAVIGSGAFNNALDCSAGGEVSVGTSVFTTDQTAFTLNALLNVPNAESGNIFLRTLNASSRVQINFTTGSYIVVDVRNLTTAPRITTTTAYTQLDQWTMLSVVYNAGAVKIFVNGTSLEFTGTASSSIPNLQTAVAKISYTTNPIKGKADNVMLASTAETDGTITTRYNMLFTPDNFSTLGAVTSVPVTPNPHTDTLKFVCSATGATSYQWYIADTVVTGETDSVITILADSAFYASKPTVYCLVNDEIKSGSWSLSQIINNSLDRIKPLFRWVKKWGW